MMRFFVFTLALAAGLSWASAGLGQQLDRNKEIRSERPAVSPAPAGSHSSPSAESTRNALAGVRRSKLLPTSWERWQRLDPVQKKRYIETLRRFSQASPQDLDRLRKIHQIKQTSRQTLDRMKALLPKVRAFVQSLSPAEARRLRNMTREARARAIAQALATQRLSPRSTNSPMPTLDIQP